jgi:hypothetical protein
MRFARLETPFGEKNRRRSPRGSVGENYGTMLIVPPARRPARPVHALLPEGRRNMREARLRIEIFVALTNRLPRSGDPPGPQIRRRLGWNARPRRPARRGAVGARQVNFDRELTETNADNVGTMATATNRRKSASRTRRGATRSMSTSSKRRTGRRTSAQRKSSSRAMSGRTNRGIGGARRRSMRGSRRSRSMAMGR